MIQKNWRMIAIIFIFTLFLVVGITVLLPAISSSAEFVSEFGVKKELKSSDGRTNILLIGVDKREDKYIQTGTLTDTMILASINPLSKDIKLVSIPRDLWVVVDGRGSKINEVFTVNSPEALKSSIEEQLGVKIHYTAQVDFSAFENLIDTLGGIDINNPVAFTDYFYPKFGWESEECGLDTEALKRSRLDELKKENKDAKIEDVYLSDNDFPCRYEVLKFAEGNIHLSGEKALKFARSRHSGDSNQGSDFARAKRQHLIISGILDKGLNLGVVVNPSKIRELYLSLTKTIETDFTVNELMVSLSMLSDAKSFKIESAVLQAGGSSEIGSVLVQGAPDSYNGLYVLVPKEPTSIINFVNDFLYSNSDSSIREPGV